MNASLAHLPSKTNETFIEEDVLSQFVPEANSRHPDDYSSDDSIHTYREEESKV